jgi:hypothetical protein
MRFLDSVGLAHHLNPEHNYLLRTNGAFAKGEAKQEIIDPSRIEVCIDESESVEEDSEPEPVAVAGETPDSISGTPILEIVEKESIGRGNNPNIPVYLKSAIAELTHVPGLKKNEIAHAFNVSPATVTHASRGRQSNGDAIPEVQMAIASISSKREEIERTALAKTMSALGILTDDDIECLGAKDKADVAMKLSKVAENMRPKGEAMMDNRIQVVINAPQVRETTHYAEVEV